MNKSGLPSQQDAALVKKILKNEGHPLFTSQLVELLNESLDRRGKEYNSMEFGTRIGKRLEDDPEIRYKNDKFNGKRSRIWSLAEWHD